MKFNQVILVSLVILLTLVLGFVISANVHAGCEPHVAFSITPWNQLQAVALCGDTPPGEVDFYVHAEFFQHFSIPALTEFQTLYLALNTEIPADYETWSIRGTWTQNWPPPTAPTHPPDYFTSTPQQPPPNSSPPPIVTPPAQEIQTIAGERFIDTPAGSVNVRSGPGTDYEPIGYLNQGDEVRLTGRSGTWYRIDYNGQTGWVYGPLTSPTDPSCSTLETWWQRWGCGLEQFN